jgi:hypothetical protein
VSLFTAADKNANATNPLILNGYGRAQVWADGRYKFVVKTASDVTLYTLDNLLYGFDEASSVYGGKTTGGGNAPALTIATLTALANGLRLTYVANASNTGAVVLTVNGNLAVSVVKGASGNTPLSGGDIREGDLVDLVYEVEGGSGRFRLMNVPTVPDLQYSKLVWGGASGGAANAQTITLSPSLLGYVAGQVFRFKAGFTNTTTTTLKVDSLSTVAIKRNGVALVGGEIQANDLVCVLFDGTDFQLLESMPAGFFLDRNNKRIGIQTTAPAAHVDIQTTGASFFRATQFSADAVGGTIVLQKNRGATVGTNLIAANNDSLGTIVFEGHNGTTYNSAAYIRAYADGTPGASANFPGRLAFAVAQDATQTPVERVFIKNDGKVGIDTATPGANLTVQGSTSLGSTSAALSVLGGASNSLTVYPALGAGSFNPTVTAGSIGAIFTGGTANTGTFFIAPWATAACGLKINSAGSVSVESSIVGGSAFSATSNLAATTAAYFYVNAASSDATAPVTIDKFSATVTTAQRFVAFRTNQGAGVAACGYITANNAGQATFTSSSDVRLKEHIEPLPPQLENLKRLKPCEFDYKDGTGHQLGFIAQEVREVYPDLVAADEDGFLMLAGLGRNEARLIKAIQELEARVAALEGR